MRLLKVGSCNLRQWSMDFECNLKNIKESISKAKEAGAAIRLGPELEVTGYGCEDHFFELDTINHSWECLKELLLGDWTDGILCSIGMPVINGSKRYNCQVLCMNRKIIMIRPKLRLASGGNYMEYRWFNAWKQKYQLVDFQLPTDIADAISQKSVPFGYGYIQFLDTIVAAEVCKELFSPFSPHTELELNGVEVILNASGSHHQLRKLDFRVQALKGATRIIGGVYMYSNHQGCDGGRLYYDGGSCVVVNGEVVALASQFSLKDVELVVAQVDLDKVTSLRGSSSSFQEQAKIKPTVQSVQIPINLCQSFDRQISLSRPIKINYHCPEEEIALGPACWLWDSLRRSGASGFLLPLSGGADSSSVCAIVGSMCQLVVNEIASGNEQVKCDAVRVGCYPEGQFPTDPKEFASRIFYTLFLGTENSSQDTRNRAKNLAAEIGSRHFNLNIDSVILSLVTFFQNLTGKLPRFKVDGGSEIENTALYNIQARIRMVIAFTLASLLPWINNKPKHHLVLSASNADKGLHGHLTKYDCSSADLNPLGSINKTDIWAFMKWGAVNLGYPTLAEIAAAPSSAELEPIRPEHRQNDELDMGITYKELSIYGRLRKNFHCGPVSMFKNLCCEWSSQYSPSEVAKKVKTFFQVYSVNRHKMTTLTPTYHMEKYSSEDNRYDLRQFLYNTSWPYQFRKVDELVQKLEGQG